MPRSAAGPLQRMPSIPNFDGSSNKQIGSKITCLSMEISMLIFGLPWAEKNPPTELCRPFSVTSGPLLQTAPDVFCGNKAETQ